MQGARACRGAECAGSSGAKRMQQRVHEGSSGRQARDGKVRQSCTRRTMVGGVMQAFQRRRS